MEEEYIKIRQWLGTGTINVFGMPMSGKDTQCQKLAEILGGKFLSSGDIIRQMEKETAPGESTANGKLIPSDLFYEWVLPYLGKPEFRNLPLVLSSIGRWHGEEKPVIEAAENAGHPLKAVIFLEVSESEIWQRWQTAKTLQDRGDRPDDADEEIFKKRVREFEEKTLPVVDYYHDAGLLIKVNGKQPRDQVFADIIDALSQHLI